MNPINAAYAFCAALAASLLFTWIVRGAMRWARIFDVPEGDRKTHRKPVAYEGGVAMYLAFLVGLVALAILEAPFIFSFSLMTGLVVGATCAVAVGIADDLLDLRPWTKLVAQLGIGYLMYQLGFRIERISNPFGAEIEFWQYLSLAGTVLWYALLMNGINMIDGLDGLATGIVAISGVTLCAIGFDLGQPFAAAMAIIVCGVCLGFLPFNFHPATIFMGDAGSLLLGFLLASITLLSSSKAPAVLTLFIPVFAVALPLFETVFAFARRMLRGQHPFRGDRSHLHHRFLDLGFSQRRTVFTFYYLTAYLGVTAYVLQRLEPKATLAMVAIISLGLFVLLENMRYLQDTRK